MKAQFVKKYGSEYVRNAELNEGGCVNPKVVEKLDCQPPSSFVVTVRAVFPLSPWRGEVDEDVLPRASSQLWVWGFQLSPRRWCRTRGRALQAQLACELTRVSIVSFFFCRSEFGLTAVLLLLLRTSHGMGVP